MQVCIFSDVTHYRDEAAALRGCQIPRRLTPPFKCPSHVAYCKPKLPYLETSHNLTGPERHFFQILFYRLGEIVTGN